jgi:Fe-S cluster biogenesis protein NfuA/Fe-S cluster assembly iron-binding protein IscA
MSTTVTPQLVVTDQAQARVRSIIADASTGSDSGSLVLRLHVESGIDDALTYRLSIIGRNAVEASEEIIALSGFDLAVAQDAAALTGGLRIDFIQTQSQAGFSFHRERSEPCACGDGCAPSGGQTAADHALTDQVREVLEELRPHLQGEGGDISLIAVSEGVVKVRFEGACGGCAMAAMTMSNVVERRLKDALSDVREVVLV